MLDMSLSLEVTPDVNSNILILLPEFVEFDYSDLPYENIQEIAYLFKKIDELLANANMKTDEEIIYLKTQIISMLYQIEDLGINRNELVRTMNSKAVSIWIDMNTGLMVDLDSQTD